MSPPIKKKYSKFWNCFSGPPPSVQYIISEMEHPDESTNVNCKAGAVLNCDGKVNVTGNVVPLPTYEQLLPYTSQAVPLNGGVTPVADNIITWFAIYEQLTQDIL